MRNAVGLLNVSLVLRFFLPRGSDNFMEGDKSDHSNVVQALVKLSFCSQLKLKLLPVLEKLPVVGLIRSS